MGDFAYGYNGPADAEPEGDENADSLRENSGSGLVNTRIADRESEVICKIFTSDAFYILLFGCFSTKHSVAFE